MYEIYGHSDIDLIPSCNEFVDSVYFSKKNISISSTNSTFSFTEEVTDIALLMKRIIELLIIFRRHGGWQIFICRFKAKTFNRPGDLTESSVVNVVLYPISIWSDWHRMGRFQIRIGSDKIRYRNPTD